ncbi:hypothetical protein Tco_0218311, partial [Tanacetum coccineum]
WVIFKVQEIGYNSDLPGHSAAKCKMPKRVNLVERLTMERSCIWAILQLFQSG